MLVCTPPKTEKAGPDEADRFVGAGDVAGGELVPPPVAHVAVL